MSRSLRKPIFRPTQTKAFTCHNVTLRAGTKVLSNSQPFGDAWHVLLQESEVEHFRIINNHYRLQSRDYYMSVKVRRPEANENADRDRIRAGFFDENDVRWSTVIDRRLCGLHGYGSTPNEKTSQPPTLLTDRARLRNQG